MIDLKKLSVDANFHMKKGNYEVAIKNFNIILEYDPYNNNALTNLGLIYINKANLDLAEKIIMKHLENIPSPSDEAIIFNHLAVVYIRSSRIPQAIKLLEHALSLDPFKIETYYNLTNAYSVFGNIEKALFYSLEAIKINNSSSEAFNNLGSVLNTMARFEEAKIAFETSIELNKNNPEPMVNLAVLQTRMGNTYESIKIYENILKNLPKGGKSQEGVIKFLLSFEYFKIGNLDKGYKFYEYGFHPNIAKTSSRAVARKFNKPLWDGKILNNKTLLIWREQGIGDEILFLSLLNDFIDKYKGTGNIIYETDYRLVSVLQRSFPSINIRVQAFGPPPEFNAVTHDYDFHLPLASMMKYVRPKLEDYKHQKPYIKLDPFQIDKFKSRLTSFKDKILIGICWRSGNIDPLRNLHYLSIDKLGPLFNNKNFQIVNLQYGDCEDELILAEKYFGINILRWSDLNLKDDFDGTFALMEQLDFIVTVGTSVHEMGGAIGAKTLFFTPPGGWHSFGQKHHVWFPSIKIFESKGENMEELIPEIVQYIKGFGISDQKS